MQHVSSVISKLGTGTQARQTKAGQTSMPTSAKFHLFQTLKDPQLEAMLSAAQEFDADMTENVNPRWLSFVGSSGAGKTLLGNLLYNHALTLTHMLKHSRMQSTWAVLSYVWTDVADRMFNEPWLVDYLSVANFLFLDDIGAGYDKSGFQAATLYRILNARVGKWTVLTSNLLTQQISDRIDTRIASRMIRGDSRVVEVQTTDFNLRH